ncbi:MAG: GntR family transcriptional regulator [Bacillota bacterium]|nr:MAG: GntR family transcriptional regulator [Bacillota bacterium]
MTGLKPIRPSEGLGHRTYMALRDAILSGQLPPGTRLVEVELAAQLGVSRTPVREALKRLAAERLVRESRGGRYEVVRLKPKEVEEVYQCRMALEGMAARLAAERASGPDPELEANLESMSAAYGRGDLAAVRDLNIRFHQRILELSGNGTLSELARQIDSWIVLVRYLGVLAHENPAYVLDQHREIAGAIAAGDGERAERLMRAHIAANMQNVLTVLSRQEA